MKQPTLKKRNPHAQALSNPLFSRKRIVPDKTKYSRKRKGKLDV